MATYKEIKGTGSQNFSSDPGNPINGQVWYNTTSSTLKVAEVLTTGAWATGGNLNVSKTNSGSTGTQTAAHVFFQSNAEEYNGSSWTNTTALSTARYEVSGAGTQTAGLAVAGFPPAPGSAVTEEYGGTSWTNGGNLNTARAAVGIAGTQTAAVVFGGSLGYPNSPNTTNVTEEYNGTSWTNSNNMSVNRVSLQCAGTQTAALGAGGYIYTASYLNTEEYDGSSWTNGGNMPTKQYRGGGAGTQTAALAFGGILSPGGMNAVLTVEYDGSSWTNGGNLGTGRYSLGVGSVAPAAAAIAIGGGNAAKNKLTEEYTGPGTTITTVTTS